MYIYDVYPTVTIVSISWVDIIDTSKDLLMWIEKNLLAYPCTR